MKEQPNQQVNRIGTAGAFSYLDFPLHEFMEGIQA